MSKNMSGVETAVSIVVSGAVLGMNLAYDKCEGDPEVAEELKKFFLAKVEEASAFHQSKKN